jgi:hypothetical protein
MAASTIGDITVLSIFGVLVFFACVYLSGRDLSGRDLSGRARVRQPEVDLDTAERIGSADRRAHHSAHKVGSRRARRCSGQTDVVK